MTSYNVVNVVRPANVSGPIVAIAFAKRFLDNNEAIYIMMQENIQWPKLALYLTNNTEAEETHTHIARQ